MKLRTKKILFIAIKLVVSVLLLIAVFRKAGLGNVVGRLQTMNPWLFILSSLLYFLTTFLASVRWSLLLFERHPVKKIFSLNLIGCFFNNFLPGAIGGDAVKAYYLYKDTGKGGSSVGSVFMDRYIGFFALLFIGMLSGLFALRELDAVGMQWITPSLFVAFLTGSLVFFRMRIGGRFSSIAAFYDYFHDCLREKRMLAMTFSLSVVIQLLSILIVYLIALGMGQKPSFTALFVFVPIITTISMIPLSISGLGIRESAYVVLFGLTGIPAEASTSISFLWFLSITATSLVGFVEFLRFKRALQ